jgi:hypothetical protein
MLRFCIFVGLTVTAFAANPHASLGGYRPVSSVVEHAQIVFDISDIKTASSSGDFTTAASIFLNGRYSCKSPSSARTLAGFVNAATVASKLDGQAFFESFTGGQGPDAAHGPIPGSGSLGLADTFWHVFVKAAAEGTGNFAGTSDTFRKVAVQKGVLGVVTMYVARELESAISKANDGSTADTGAAHAWDEGWAFYYGSVPDPDQGKYSAWEFAYKRDLDYAYDSDNNAVAGAVKAQDKVLHYFLEGLKASRTATLDIPKMIEARNNIYRMLALTSIRAALKYAYTTQKDGYSESYHIEAYAYFLAAAGWVEQAAPGVGTAVLALLDYTKASSDLNSDLYCAVKAALIPAYEPLGLDCDMVGTYKKLPADKTCASLPACPATTTLPAGLSSYHPVTDTSAGSNTDCGVDFADFGVTTTEAPSNAFSQRSPLMAGLAVAFGGLFL